MSGHSYTLCRIIFAPGRFVVLGKFPRIAAEKVSWWKLCEIGRYPDKRFHLGCYQQEPMAIVPPVQRADADWISRDQCPATNPIQKSECKNTIESVQKRTRRICAVQRVDY